MPAYTTLARALALLALLALAGCGETPADPDAGRAPDAASPGTDAFVAGGDDAFSPSDPDAFAPSDPDTGVTPTVLFSRDIAPILESNCRGSGCHGTPQTFFLGGGRACMGMAFVVAGDPDASFVVDKLEGTMPASCGMQMPRGRTPLSAANLATIRTWISEGALNN